MFQETKVMRPRFWAGLIRGRNHRNDAGYSLIETMFALVFLGIGLLAMAQSIPLASRQLTSSRNHTSSVEAAQTVLERLATEDYNSANLTAGSHYETAGTRTISYTVQDNVPVPGNKRIDLSISWTEAEGTKTLNYTTIVHR